MTRRARSSPARPSARPHGRVPSSLPPRASEMLLVLFLAVYIGYARFLGPWHRHWGARDDEVTAPMPLDERVANPTAISTRAITIDVPPEKVWPWLAQMGDKPRAGYYS